MTTTGISLIVSTFGSTETPTTSGTDAVTVANNLASWVKQYDLQGVDIDYEVQLQFTLDMCRELARFSRGMLGHHCIRL